MSVDQRTRETTIHGIRVVIAEGLNELGAMEITYSLWGATPGTQPVAVIQAAIADPDNPDSLCGYVVQGFALSEPDGHGMWIYDLDTEGPQAFALACQRAIDTIKELVPDIPRQGIDN